MSFEIEKNIIKIKKDCKTCDRIKVCVFHSKMANLCKTNEFYKMTEYPEWNNSLEAFELHARCRFFKLSYIIPDNNSLTLDVDKDIINEIIRLETPENTTQWSPRIKENIVEYSIKNSTPVIIKITELLAKYRFHE